MRPALIKAAKFYSLPAAIGVLLGAVLALGWFFLRGAGPFAPHPQPAPPDPLQSAAMAYMKAHPVPPRPGMYTGIIIEGDRPGARSWIVTMAARDGELVDAECGNRAVDDCSWRWRSRLLGAYVYADSEGNATAYASHPRNIHVIRYRALTLPGTDTP